MRERQLLSERIENLKQSITAEFEARQAQKLVKNLNFWREKEVGDYGHWAMQRRESRKLRKHFITGGERREKLYNYK